MVIANEKIVSIFYFVNWVKWLLMGDSGECIDYLLENSREFESFRVERKKRREEEKE